VEQSGMLRRIYGGAVPPRLDLERPVTERGKVNVRGKAKVAELAEVLVEDGMSIFYRLEYDDNSLRAGVWQGRNPWERWDDKLH